MLATVNVHAVNPQTYAGIAQLPRKIHHEFGVLAGVAEEIANFVHSVSALFPELAQSTSGAPEPLSRYAEPEVRSWPKLNGPERALPSPTMAET
jgi:hypothetical protein